MKEDINLIILHSNPWALGMLFAFLEYEKKLENNSLNR